MNYAKFVNRKEELRFLKEVLSSDKFQLIPVWGRRRVGKTALLMKALGGKGIYFIAKEVSALDNIRSFQEECATSLGDPTISDLAPDWEAIFRYLAKKDLAIVLDEFPYLVASDPGVPSTFQKIVETQLLGTKTKLILCGSSVRMMESHVLDYRSPLYGRRTGQIRLSALGFEHLKEFFPDYSLEDLVRVFGVCGGIPMYLQQFKGDRSFEQNVLHEVLDPTNFLYFEADFLLKQEFLQISTYKSILKELAAGRTKMDEIRAALGAGKSDISPYMSNLIEVGLVEKCVPVTEDPSRSRKGIYRIKDHFLKFHYKYIHPRAVMIESGNSEGVIENIAEDLDTYLGPVFEDVVREAFLKWSKDTKTMWDNVGGWWYKEDELDIVALSAQRNEALFGEVKWTRNPVGTEALDRLKSRAPLVRWGNAGRKDRFLMVSSGGFTKKCLERMDAEGVAHWDMDTLKRIFWGKNG